ncbi:MAG: caspase family protein [Flavobacteriales bacterium]|nr:caspase family protein [Flavobacteriales bacterium]
MKGVIQGVVCLLGALAAGTWAVDAQVEAVTKRAMTIQRRPVIAPPQLSIVEGSVRFEDNNGNGYLDANEQATLTYKLNNAPTALGDAQGMVCEIRLEGASSGVTVSEQIRLADLPRGATMEFAVPIQSSMKTKDGELKVFLKIQEPLGFGPPETSVNINTLEFRQPELLVVDHRVKEGEIIRGQAFTYQFLVRNKGAGFAYDVRCELELLDEGVQPLSTQSFKFNQMEPGEVKELWVSVIVPPDYPHQEVQFKVVLDESLGRYAETFIGALPLEAMLDQAMWQVPTSDGSGSGSAVFFGSDVDRNIPTVKKVQDQRFALIIGNEKYATSNPGLNPTQNVPFAEADAHIMQQYLQKLWGIPEENIILEINATKVTMERALAQLSNFAEALEGEAELIFYYSGHGLPSEATKEPFLIPVDVDGDAPELGLSLEQVYAELGETPTKRTTVFLDACFSGGARNESLIAGMKGLARVPEEVEAGGNAVVFASSSGNQSSGVFEDQEHGYFTYFLLKYMQESKGKLNYGDMFDGVRKEVKLQSNRDGRDQEPSVRVAPTIIDEWRLWGLDD